MKILLRIFLFLLWLKAEICLGQIDIPFFGNQNLVSGYQQDIQGETIAYFSVYPDYVKEALLTRCTNGKKSIEWETNIVPLNFQSPYIYFSWIAAHSTGTNSGTRNFDLYVNDKYELTFTTFPSSYPTYWSYGSSDSTRLVFEFKTKDQYNDAHGFAYLRIPAKLLTTGKAVRLKVTGQNQNSNDWYMTFKYGLEEKLEIVPLPFMLKGEKQQQPLMVNALHFGKDAKLQLDFNSGNKKTFTVQNGLNRFYIPLDAVKLPTHLKIKAILENKFLSDAEVVLKPVKPRTIYFVHHSHNDIGYSNLQADVEKIQNKNINDALNLIDKSVSNPEGSRFVWNIESLWAVENYLHIATASEKRKFTDAVNNESICLAGFYANILTGLCTSEEMNWIFEYADRLRSEYHFKINSAMMTDIPGMSWSMVRAMAQNGIRYLSQGPNYGSSLPDLGDRIGNTMRATGNKAFWWKSTDGTDSVLMWTCGRGYSSWHGYNAGTINERGPLKIADYMNELDSISYPYEMVQWRYSIKADNGPTDSSLATFVKHWNEKYSSPEIVISNVSQMFEAFEKKYGDKIPVLTGDFTPYWEDGAYSTAKEETENRTISLRLVQLEKIAKQQHIELNKNILYRAHRSVVMFHEHTWGSWNSVSEPDADFTVQQWLYKKAFADSAKIYCDELQNQLNNLLSKPGVLFVLNSLPFKRSEMIQLENSLCEGFNAVKKIDGKLIPLLKMDTEHFTFQSDSIDAFGIATYSLTKVDLKKQQTGDTIAIDFDSLSGSVNKLIYKGFNLVDNKSEYKGLFNSLYVAGYNPKEYKSSSLIEKNVISDNALVKTIAINQSLEGTNGVKVTIVQQKNDPIIKAHVEINKKSIRGKEGIHIALPFNLKNALTRIGMDSTFYIPGDRQLQGANKDYVCAQRWIDVSDKALGVTIVCPQGVLFEVGEMNNESLSNRGLKKWKKEMHSSSVLFLYALNNYWYTNYKADQEGDVQFDFYLLMHDAFDLNQSLRFAYSAAEPLMVIKK